jgi:hypothetical protein
MAEIGTIRYWQIQVIVQELLIFQDVKYFHCAGQQQIKTASSTSVRVAPEQITCGTLTMVIPIFNLIGQKVAQI